ncbi:MAG: NmrA family NAD(P)-binding protein [Acidobacteriota bacterium]|nr:NmrA family NAD(P)-binding protein [Acidobacteriota bacterium]
MILITGASGSAGGAVLEAAIEAGAPLRAMYRNKDDAGKAPKGVETVQADFADKSSLRTALRGIESVFLVCGPVPQLVELEGNMIDACKEAGVGHVVLNSALGAGDFTKSFPSWHYQAEQKLQNSGLAYTILRPNGFMQNIVSYNAGSIRTQGAFYAAMGDAKISMIDVRDVGSAAAKILLDPQNHAGKTYELNGPEAVSNSDIADRISRVAGRNISYVDIPEEAQRQAMLDI